MTSIVKATAAILRAVLLVFVLGAGVCFDLVAALIYGELAEPSAPSPRH